MSDYQLKKIPPLGGYKADIGGIAIEEITDLAIVSIAVPLVEGGRATLEAAVKKAWNATLPAPGASALSADGNTRFLGLAPNQIFALFPYDGADADLIVGDKLRGTGYVTLQSDNWVVLQVSGANVRAALARICQIDLDPAVFPVGAMARTVMEHMGVVILRMDADAYLLLSAWSSAHSFLHAVETSARNGK